VLAILAVFIPVNPFMPDIGIDNSWEWGMNESVAKKVDFGTDILFTFGPYASIYTRDYHPATAGIMFYGSLFLAIGFIILALQLFSAARTRWYWAFILFLACELTLFGSFLYLYPLLFIFSIYRLTQQEGRATLSPAATLFYILLIFPLGLLGLVKTSFMLLAAGITGMASLITWARNMKTLSMGMLLAFPVSTLLFWILAGQHPGGVVSYLSGAIPIVQGYTEAMATTGPLSEVGLYLLASMVSLGFILLAGYTSKISRYFLFLSIAWFLFLSFKSGFVRHDTHALTCAIVILAMGVMLPVLIRYKWIALVAGLNIFTGLYILFNQHQRSVYHVLKPMVQKYPAFMGDVAKWMTGNAGLNAHFYAKLDEIRKVFPLPQLKGTTDIYSYNQSPLLASGNIWSPRPVFQGYVAYTSELAAVNENHLLSPAAPDNILFRLETIDKRLPSLDDGLSWPTIINNYSGDSLSNGYLLLKKKTSQNKRPAQKEIFSTTCTLGEEISLPDSSGLVFARIDIRANLKGKLMKFLYLIPPLQIALTLKDGTVKTYRIISGMTETGFLLSPLTEDTREFGMLFHDPVHLANKQVRSFRIFTAGMGHRLHTWNTRYEIHLFRILFDK
jgi:hypothetical protein